MNLKPAKEINGVPLYLIQATAEDGHTAVFAYLRTPFKLFAGAGGDVTSAVADVMAGAFPDMPAEAASAALLGLPALEEVEHVRGDA